MKKLALVLLAGVLAFGAVLYLAVWRPLFALPETLPRAEQALATPDLLVLAGVNAKQAVFLERWFMDTPAASPPGSALPVIGERSLLDHLRGARVDPRRDLDYVLYALYPGKDAGVRQAIALMGRFEPAAIDAYLKDELHAEPVTRAGHAAYEVTLPDPNSCKTAGSWIVTAEPGSILLTDPVSYEALAPRLAGQPQDAGALRWWHDLARTDVAGVAIRRPDRWESGTPIPLVGLAGNALAPQLEAFERAYLGLGITAVPPAGDLRVVLDARDAGRAAEQIKAWQRAVDDSRARWTTAMPAVARLYEDLSIKTEGARSTVDVTMSRATLGRLQDLGSELVSQIFGGFGINSDAVRSTAAGADQIETNPPKFEPTASTVALRAYDPKAQFAEQVDAGAGPFGVRLDAIRLAPKPEGGLELTIAGFANGIPNIASDPGRAKLAVDSVTSVGGQELLKREDCGRERNGKPADFASSMPPRLSATKTVHLIPGADARSLRRISGHIALRLPTRTEAVTIADPKPGTAVEKHGARITINQLAGGTLAYQVTGDRNRVLLVHALNAKGQPLASSMKMSGDLLLGSGFAGRIDYNGTIAALEIVFSAEEQTAEFPFALTDFSFAGEKRPVARDDAPDFQPLSPQALHAQYPKPLPSAEKLEPRLAASEVAPFEISLDKAQPFFQLGLTVGVRGPDAPGFRRRFDLGQLQLTRVSLKDGTALSPPEPGKADRSVWSAPLRFMSSPKQGVLSAPLNFSVDTKAKPQDLKSVEGKLTLRFPRAIDTVRLDDLGVGQTVQSGGIKGTIAARSRQGVTIETSADAERVVYVRLLDAQGQALMFGSPTIAALPDGGTRIDLSPFDPPARAEVVIARELETETLPFSLTLP